MTTRGGVNSHGWGWLRWWGGWHHARGTPVQCFQREADSYLCRHTFTNKIVYWMEKAHINAHIRLLARPQCLS